jgi:hypothetical protein
VVFLQCELLGLVHSHVERERGTSKRVRRFAALRKADEEDTRRIETTRRARPTKTKISPPTTMSTRTVWVQIYYQGKGELEGEPFEVEGPLRNVYALKKAVKEACSNALSHCDAMSLTVYKECTAVPVLERTDALDPADKVPTGTSSKKPLIVVAPQQQQQMVSSGFPLLG